MKKKENIAGVIFDDTGTTPIIDSDKSEYYIPFDKDEEYFSVYENYVAFVKGCESLVRKHRFYKVYIKYLIEVVGMRVCQVLPNIEVSEKKKGSRGVTIEMHHGPILTLFDTCSIVLDHLRHIGEPNITTYKVANIVLEEHRLNHVRVMLVCKSVHDQIHLNNVQLNYNMGFGDTKAFLDKFPVHDKNIKRGINEYIEWSKTHDSFDNHVFDISEKLKEWGNNDADEFQYVNMKGDV